MMSKKQGKPPAKKPVNKNTLIDIYQKSDICLGRGGMAIVYTGGYAPDCGDPNMMFAIKEMQIKGKIQQSGLDQINVLRKLRHPNIVRLIDARKHQNSMYLILEYCADGNLQKFIHTNRPDNLSEAGILRIFAQVVMAMMFLQEKKIIHRDIKPSNILMQDVCPKLADFGVAKMIDKYKQNITFEGTHVYMSPQMLKQENYTSLTDMWSLGVTLYFMVFKTEPWVYRNNNYQLLNDIIKGFNEQTVVPKENITVQLKTLILRMLTIKEEDRLSWNQLYNHQLLKQYIKQYETEENRLEQSYAQTEEIKIEQFIKFNSINTEEKVEKRGQELNQMFRASKLKVDHGMEAYRKICRVKEKCKFMKRILMDLKQYRKQQVVQKYKHLFLKCHYLLAKRSFILSRDLNHIALLKSNREGIINIPLKQFNEFMQDPKYTKKLNQVKNTAEDLFKYNGNEWKSMVQQFTRALRDVKIFDQSDQKHLSIYTTETLEQTKELIVVFNYNFLELFLHLSKHIVDTYSNALYMEIEKSKFLAQFQVDIMFVYDLIVLLCFHNLGDKVNFETYYQKRDFASIQEIVFRIITAHKRWAGTNKNS